MANLVSDIAERMQHRVRSLATKINSKEDAVNTVLTCWMDPIVQTVSEHKNSIGVVVIDDAMTAEIVKYAIGLYDNYIVPINLPGIPDRIIEPLVDASIRSLIPAAVKAIIDAVT